MTRLHLAPYYHPTTICLVDDNQSFLDSLQLELPTAWATVSFTQPEDALAFLNTPPELAPLVDRCFHMQVRPDTNAQTIHLDLGLIEQEINRVQRFARTSVLLVDYAMPSLSGLELCAELADPYLKKIMLTGVADEKIAVRAFNEGLIDRFIPKHSANAMLDIRRHVAEMQLAYFNQYTNHLRSALALSPPGFLTEQSVADFVRGLMSENDLVEYYLVNEPLGLLLLNRHGEAIRLILQNPEQHARAAESATRAGAPQRLLDDLLAGVRLCHFWEHPQDFYGDEPFPWEDQMPTCQQLPGSTPWYAAVVTNPPGDIDFDPTSSSYAAFLDNIGA